MGCVAGYGLACCLGLLWGLRLFLRLVLPLLLRVALSLVLLFLVDMVVNELKHRIDLWDPTLVCVVCARVFFMVRTLAPMYFWVVVAASARMLRGAQVFAQCLGARSGL